MYGIEHSSSNGHHKNAKNLVIRLKFMRFKKDNSFFITGLTSPIDTDSLDHQDKEADNEFHRWFALADLALHNQSPTEETIEEMTQLARAEQEKIKKRIRRTAEVFKRQSKTKQ